jgi:hypothetical protein
MPKRAVRKPRRAARVWGGPRPGIPLQSVTTAELRARVYFYPGSDATRRERNRIECRRHRARRELARRELEVLPCLS